MVGAVNPLWKVNFQPGARSLAAAGSHAPPAPPLRRRKPRHNSPLASNATWKVASNKQKRLVYSWRCNNLFNVRQFVHVTRNRVKHTPYTNPYTNALSITPSGLVAAVILVWCQCYYRCGRRKPGRTQIWTIPGRYYFNIDHRF